MAATCERARHESDRDNDAPHPHDTTRLRPRRPPSSRRNRRSSASRHHSLLVALYDLGIADPGLAHVGTGLAERTALSEQIPALIETHLDRFEPAVLGLVQPALGSALIEIVLFRDHLLDAIVDPLVFHLHSSVIVEGLQLNSRGSRR